MLKKFKKVTLAPHIFCGELPQIIVKNVLTNQKESPKENRVIVAITSIRRLQYHCEVLPTFGRQ